MKHSFQQILPTSSYGRILRRFWGNVTGDPDLDVGHLVLAMLVEESLGSRCLSNLGLSIQKVADGCLGPSVANAAAAFLSEESGLDVPVPVCSDAELFQQQKKAVWFQAVHDRANLIARHGCESELTSCHLVQALVEIEGPARSRLAQLQISKRKVQLQMSTNSASPEPLKVESEWLPELEGSENLCSSQTQTNENAINLDSRVLTLLDANLNRAREAVRVLEDFARFVVNDGSISQKLKELRHGIVACEQLLADGQRPYLFYRNVDRDVGTNITTAAELRRDSITDVVTANARRAQEALRSLEEFGKTLRSEFAIRIKQLRYDSYKLEQQLAQRSSELSVSDFDSERRRRRQRLNHAHLYVLITEEYCALPWKQVVEESLEGGADVLQLREKNLADSELVERSRWIRSACRESGALFILNDRCDLAERVDADGVHLGQDDESVQSARAILKSSRLIGVSTHSRQQIDAIDPRQVDYIGVGPVFPSSTKQFEDFAGLEFVMEARQHSPVPWFAIGGVQQSNVDEVKAVGASRIAVSSAVIVSGKPAEAAAMLRSVFSRSPMAQDPSGDL